MLLIENYFSKIINIYKLREDNMDWKLALKVGGPSVIAAFVFHSLFKSYMQQSELIQSNEILNYVFLLMVFLFCCLFMWMVLRPKPDANTPAEFKQKVTDNKIIDNEVDGPLNAGAANSDIINNEFKNNKVKGAMNIGVDK